MFWEEDEDKSLPYQTPDDILDALFSIRCKQLPLDHAWLLKEAISNALNDTSLANYNKAPLGIHHIYVAESSNGWARPDESIESKLYPSKRTKLIIRVHKNHLDRLSSLSDCEVAIGDHSLEIGKMKTRLLTNSSVIFSRHVVSQDSNETETAFLERNAFEILNLTGVKTKKMMCGKSHQLVTPGGPIHTRHLMIADLESETSIKLQQFGLGTHRDLGCGIFLPHKGIKSLNSTE